MDKSNKRPKRCKYTICRNVNLSGHDLNSSVMFEETKLRRAVINIGVADDRDRYLNVLELKSLHGLHPQV